MNFPPELKQIIWNFLEPHSQVQLVSGVPIDDSFSSVHSLVKESVEERIDPHFASDVNFAKVQCSIPHTYMLDRDMMNTFKLSGTTPFFSLKQLDTFLSKFEMDPGLGTINIQLPLEQIASIGQYPHISKVKINLTILKEHQGNRLFDLRNVPKNVIGLSFLSPLRSDIARQVIMRQSFCVCANIPHHIEKIHLYSPRQYPFKALPNLKELIIDTSTADLFESDFDKCTRLESLTLMSLKFPLSVKGPLTRTLTHLCIEKIEIRYLFDWDPFSCHLTSFYNLKHLELCITNFDNVPLLNDIELPDLLSLNIKINQQITTAFKFPRTLKKLVLDCTAFNVTPNRNLPKDLESLSLYCSKSNFVPKGYKFKNLIMPAPEYIPPSVEYLKTRTPYDYSSLDNLRVLEVGFTSPGTLITPPGLVSLTISKSAAFERFQLNEGLKDLTVIDSMLPLGLVLPSSLLYFTLYNSNDTDETFSAVLPEGLLGLQLQNVDVPFLQPLPKLIFAQLTDITGVSEQNWKSFESLKTLVVKCNSFPYDLIERLPENLQSLQCLSTVEDELQLDYHRDGTGTATFKPVKKVVIKPRPVSFVGCNLEHFVCPEDPGKSEVILPESLKILDCSGLEKPASCFDFKAVKDCEVIAKKGNVTNLPSWLKFIEVKKYDRA